MEYIKKLDPRLKTTIGIIFILLGFAALVTPFTPGSWLIFLGLELLGSRLFISATKKKEDSKSPKEKTPD